MAGTDPQQCYFCGHPLAQPRCGTIPLCGDCPESREWREIWQQQYRQPLEGSASDAAPRRTNDTDPEDGERGPPTGDQAGANLGTHRPAVTEL